ncbi:MAG: Ltp family lipoprotein [Holdemanella porci]
MKKGLKVFLTAAIVLSAVACSTTSDEETKTKDTKEKIVETKEDTSVPKEYRNALRSAKTYSDMMHMSKQGIYDQLTSEYGEKFDAEAAQYAIDNLNADYNENALKCGENCTKSDAYVKSSNSMITQLQKMAEKFTPEEAQMA